jgi:hypothetical protein
MKPTAPLRNKLSTLATAPLPWRNIVSISPDGHWLLCFRHYGSHWQENYLYRSDDGVQFVPAQELIRRRRCRKTGRITTSKNGALLTAERSLAPLA